MSNLAKYSDEDMLELVSSDIEKELKNRGYEYGWYKKVNFVGVIYILVNPAFSNLVKIGYADDVEKRMKSLNSSSGLPDPYHCYAVFKVKKRLEDLRLHTLIDTLDPTLRHAKNREFYEISKEKAYEVLSAIAQINGDEDCLILNPLHDEYFEEIEEKSISVDNKTEQQESVIDSKVKKKERLTFEMLNIPKGSILTFSDDEKVTVKTVDNKNHVEYKGETYPLSTIAAILKNYSTAQGGMFFKYNGKLLIDLRKELGK
ncbi:T5orf172 domain-containing protein [Butyrivibrio proteoclasticus]|uniref:T5orf172 domain-containing protein n=1 Tax=Butyrivibrio proteoclasticus TaxID=43305 RepID=A0A1I5XW90_9FIRM|nr:GIY-YIG nuclease family protein [Butyrivibrio proteoclasticus]SFQ36251.1 T5orf172 domain-containing protein [Butyrivibrio proteoclasticus]